MCDCFHVVLPTWPGAPGSVSGHQLQPEEPDLETEEDASVTEGPAGEVIRPRPQGSSPIYECSTEGAGPGVQDDIASRQGSLGRRRSWWKRDSGDSRTFSSMSRPEPVQEATEVTLKTEVEAGASGYSVTGGGDQGIFVKQVLKDSSAAKLFSLREGDQLLSATIFFDDIKYEDALKILQYSEPYKVQFQIKRKLPASEDKGGALRSSQHESVASGKQEKDVADGCAETPKKTLEEDGDQERLIAKPRETRGRKARERLSWPKFQGMKGKQGPGPRRSHSSSEAQERGSARELSPTSTDTEVQCSGDHGEQSAGRDGQKRRRRFPSLRFRKGSRQDPPIMGRQDREVLGEPDSTRKLEDTWAGGTEAQKARQVLTTVQDAEPSSLGHWEGATVRQQRKTKQVKPTAGETAGEEARAGPALDDEREEPQGLTKKITAVSLRGTESTLRRTEEIHVRIRDLKTPTFTFPREKVPGTEDKTWRRAEERRETAWVGRAGTQAEGQAEADQQDKEPGTSGGMGRSQERELGETELRGTQPGQGEDRDKERGELKTKLPRFKMLAFGWSPAKEATRHMRNDIREKEEISGTLETTEVGGRGHKSEGKDPKGELGGLQLEEALPSMNVDVQGAGSKLEGEVATKDGKFKMPKFKMPSFGMSGPGKSIEASLEVSTPKVDAEVALSTIQADLKSPEAGTQQPSTDMEMSAGQVAVKVPEVELPAASTGASLKSHLPKVQMPSLKMPSVELKGPHVDVKGPKVDVKVPKTEVKGPTGEPSGPELEAALPSMEVDVQAPSGHLEVEVAAKDSKFKMPKFKMPSFGMSGPGKSIEASLEVSTPKVEAEVALPTIQADLKSPEAGTQQPSTDVEMPAGQVAVKVPEVEVPAASTGASLKGHLPKVQMPSIKMPKVELKGPQVDVKGPKAEAKGPKGELSGPELEVALPIVDVDVQAPGHKLEGEVSTKDSKLKMPKFKMPSFGVSASGKAIEASLEASTRKLEAEVALPAIQGDLKSPEPGAQQPPSGVDFPAVQAAAKLPEGELPSASTGASLKGHLPKVQMPSLKMPKVELKGPQVEVKDPKAEVKVPKGELSGPELEAAVPSGEVDIQATGGKLEGEVATKDGKFKMPKFKMPSFGVSAPGKSIEASLEVSASKLEAEVALPAIQGDLKRPEAHAQLPTTDVELPAGQLAVKVPEGDLAEEEMPAALGGASLKGHLPKVQMPSLKMPSVELKGPHVDVKGPKVDVKVPKTEVKGPMGEPSGPELEAALPSMEVDVQAPSGHLEVEVAAKDSKFKMPKFKMPSFGMSGPGKSIEASLEVSTPKVEAEVALPTIQGDLKSPEAGTQQPSTDAEMPAGQVAVKVPEVEVPAASTGASLKGHLPKVQMPSIKMPKVELKGPQVDVKGPKAEAKGPKGELSGPELEVALPIVDVDVQAPGHKLEGEVSTKDSKLKMPKFKMPSFGVSASGKAIEASLEASTRKLEAEVALPAIQGDLKSPEPGAQQPPSGVDFPAVQAAAKLPEGELPSVSTGASLKGHLPKVQMPSLKMPKVELKGPQVEVKDPKAEVKVPKGELSGPELEAAVPSGEVDIQATGGKLEGEVATKDGKFKMPKFKMPSFGVSAPGKSIEASLEVSASKLEAEVALPAIQGDLKRPEAHAQLPTTDVELPAGQLAVKVPEGDLAEEEMPAALGGASLKGHLPKVQMPSLKMPSVELKGPHVDVKGPKVDVKVPKTEVKGPTGEPSGPELEAALPSMEVDVQAPSGHLEVEVAAKDSKFKMPKFKMPSFGMSGPGKSIEASLEVSTPKVEAEVALPTIQGDLKSPEAGTQQPSTDVEMPAGQVAVKVPEVEVPAASTGASLKGHLPKVQMPSIKMPKVELKGPQVDVKGPKAEAKGPKGELSGPELEVALPIVDVDVQAPGHKLEGEVSTKDSKLKMPKFKMPSFGVSASGKAIEASLEASTRKLEAEVALPAIQGDLKSPEPGAQQPPSGVDFPAVQAAAKLPEGELPSASTGASLKGHLPKMPSLKMPKVELKGPQVEVKDPKAEVKVPKGELSGPELEAAVPSGEVDIQATGGKLEGEVATKDGKFKMPKFKMPSFGVSAPGKSIEASLEVSASKLEAEVALPAIQGDLKRPEAHAQLPTTDVELPAGQLAVKVPKGDLAEEEMPAALGGASLKGHLPKVQMPSLKMPSVELKGPHVDVKGPKVDVKVPKTEVKGPTGEPSGPELEAALPSMEVDVQAPSGQLEVEVAAKDSKFKMPKFKMPSFGMSGPGKSIEASLEVSTPKVEAEVALPTIQGDLKSPEAGTQQPSTDVEMPAGQVAVKVPEVEVPAASTGASLKGHLPKVQMPSIKMPKVELKGPQVDVKGPKAEAKGPKGELSGPELEVALPIVDVDVQAPGHKLEGEVSTKDSKLKMPKFKMPSFGVSASGKAIEASLEASTRKLEAEVALPAIQGDLKSPEPGAQQPPSGVDFPAVQAAAKLPEGELPSASTGASLKGHLPKMPSLKMPKVELKGPQVEVKDPKAEVKVPKGELSGPELEAAVPSGEVDIQATGGKLEGEVATKDGKFKMPKFKMPSFGVSAPGKSIEASLEVSASKLEAEVALPAIQGDLKRPEAHAQLPTTDVELPAGQLAVKVPEGDLAEEEMPAALGGASLKGHLPKVQMPSLKMPSVELKGPHVDVKGPKVDVKVPKTEVKGPTGEPSGPELEAALPSMEVDVQAPSGHLEVEVAAKDSKFKMPKFKMPSFGMSGPGKSIEASLEVSTPKVEAEVALPTIQGDLKSPEAGTQQPSTDVEMPAGQVAVKVPEVEVPAASTGASLKGHLPKVQMPSLKMPSVELKGPHVDVKGPKVDVKVPKTEVKGPTGEPSGPELEAALPSMEVDVQAPSGQLEVEVAAKDSKFKMPKFKMPSFGMSGPGKSIEASLEVSTPKVEAEVALPTIQGDLKSPEAGTQQPSTDVEMPAGQVAVKVPEVEVPAASTGASLKGHLPKVQMPSIKMPKVELKGPQVDVKGPKAEAKGPKGELSGPELEVALPIVDVDVQAPGHKLEGEVSTKDSKLKMPKFKMPSFGVSASGKAIEASLEASTRKLEAEVALPAIQGDLKSPEPGAQQPPSGVDFPAVQAAAKLPEGELPSASTGASLKGHLPKMPSLKMPKVELKGPQVEVKDPKAEVKVPKGELSGPELEAAVPSGEVDIQATGGKLEGEVATKDGKFKMPKFKMPSFGVSAPGKSIEASLEVSASKLEAEVALPAIQGDLKRPEAHAQLPTTDVELPAGQLAVKVPEGDLAEEEMPAALGGASLKGHLPKVQMPSLKMPSVELKGPHVDVKGPKVDVKVPKTEVKGPTGEPSGPELEAALPSMEVDVQAPSGHLEVEVAAKDSKFKMPKFKMPSFGMSGPGKSIEASLEVSTPKVEAEVALPTIQADLKSPEAGTQQPSTDVEMPAGQVAVKVPEVEVPAASTGASLKGHLPKVQMPSIKMPKVELKGPQVDVKGPKAEAKGPKGELSGPELEVALPIVDVDVQAPGHKLEGEVSTKDSKLKMPKFKMPSFGVSASGKAIEASLEASTRKLEAEVALPAIQGDLKSPEPGAQQPPSGVDFPAVQAAAKLPEGELPSASTGASLKGHLPKVQMPSLKMPKVELKGPQVEVKDPKAEVKVPKGELSSPELEAAVPSGEVDIQATGGKLEGEVATKDGKFKMPKFKMPSFGVSAPGKSIEASLEVSASKLEAEVALPAIQGDLKRPEAHAQLPTTDVELPAGQLAVKVPEGDLAEEEMPAALGGASLKGHLPKVQMPSLKMPSVELKGPHVDVKGPKVDVKVPKTEVKGPTGEPSGPELEAALPSMEVDVQAPSGQLEVEVAAKDSKFKMPKFKMPSFGMSGPGKSIEASLEVSTPKVEAEVALPTIQADLKSPEAGTQQPSTDVEMPAGQVAVKVPEVEVPAASTGASLKGHLPKVQMPSIKMPKVELKGPQVDVKGPKAEAKGPKGELSGPELEVALPIVDVDVQAPGHKLEGEVSTKDSKLKMPKFKMPSFGVSASGKAIEASLEASTRKLEAEVALPAIQGDLKSPEPGAQQPPSGVDFPAVQAAAKLPEGELPSASTGASLKGHLPKMPSLKMPKVELKGPQVEVKDPKAEVKVPKGELSGPELEAAVPSGEVDIQATGGKLEGEVATKDGKFKMPKFKMPSFGVSAPGKSIEASLEVSASKLEAEVALPAIQGDLKRPEAHAQLPTTDVELPAGQLAVKVPEGDLAEEEMPAALGGASLKGHLPKVQMPSLKMPSVELKGPHVDVKGPKVDVKVPKTEVKGPTGEPSGPELEAALPSMEVDVQAPSGHLEVEVAAKDSKFKMPKFKMPSFGMSGPGKSIEASLEVSTPKVEAEVALPTIQADLKSPEAGTQQPSTDVEMPAGQVAVKVPEVEVPAASTGASLKGHLPKVQMPSIKMPKVELKGPQVDVKGPKAEAKGPKGELSGPELEVALPIVDVDVQAPGHKLEGEVSTKDSKLKMPKFKMPSFGMSGPGKSIEASLELSTPKLEAEVALSTIQGDLKSPETGAQLPSADVDLHSGQSAVKLPEAALPVSELLPSDGGTENAVFSGGVTGSSVVLPLMSETLTQFHGPALSPPQHGAPQHGASESLSVAPYVALWSSGFPQSEEPPPAHPSGHPTPPLSPPTVTFPKFHKPRFMVSVPLTVVPEGDSGIAVQGAVLPHGQAPGQDALAPEVHVSHLTGFPVAPGAAPMSEIIEQPLSLSVGAAVAEGPEGEWAGSPSKRNRFKLPLFSRSPKKEAKSAGDSLCHLEDPSGSLTVDLDHEDSQPGVQGSHMEAHIALPPGKEGDSERTRKVGFSLPRLALPKLKVSKGRAGPRPQGDIDTVLSSSTAAGDCEATGRGGRKDGMGSTSLPERPHEAGHVAPQLPQTPMPSVGFAKPAFQSAPAKEGARWCEPDPRQDPGVGEDSKGSGLGDILGRQPPREGTAPTPKDTLKPSPGYADRGPALDSPEEAPTTVVPAADSKEHWSRMPRLHVPGFGGSLSKQCSGAREQNVAQVHMLAATAPAEMAAASSVLESSAPRSEVEASVSLQPSNTKAVVTGSGSASHPDVLRLDLHAPTVGKPGVDQPHSEVQIRPAEGSLPLQKPSSWPPEPQTPAAERCDLTKEDERVELRPSLPEGPVMLRVSSTDVPSQVSVVDMRQLWEDSVLTVTFPKLRAPRFSFPAPGSEADVFFPVVRDVRGAGPGVDPGPGLWDASLLSAGPDCLSKASPVSKVKVHIQAEQGASHQVVVCSQVTREHAERVVPEAFSSQIVRESEIPTSTVQTPSYGFSLLKVKTLGPPAQAPDPRGQESSAATRADSLSEDGAPEAAEPFEVISASASLPGPRTLGSDIPARPPPADSGSEDDEEPAEILEFLPEDSGEAAAPPAAENRVLKGRPEGKKPSGVFWSWLPSIGFSSSVSETTADSREDAQRSVPVQTQPAPRPDLELPKKQERVGWFRLPKLGFSSSPAKNAKSIEDEAGLAERTLQEESVTFFDAQESFSPEEKEGEPAGSTPGAIGMVASLARTELILLEPQAPTSEESVPGPTSK
ncbi:protein AHNAK2 isoform X4 [Cavia porcellus]|uniref:protein AHNAK2 isoform X4 n=1 Tax=Cavia porcellus TaxID=10141 RepID=UPI002FE0DC07